MRTKVLIAILVGFLVISVVAVGLLVGNDKAKEKPNGPGEKAKAQNLKKIEFIHWKKGFGKPTCNNNGICEPELGEKGNCPDCKNGGEEPPTKCYAFMGQYGKRYLKWSELPITYVINPTNSGLDDVTTAISAGAEHWDSYAGTELFNDTYIEDESVSYRVQDYTNAISFENYYSDPGIIGACTVWYNPATKEIVEFDIVFETDYTWGYAGPTNEDDLGNTDIMDLQNIATHELGHGLGLSDVYNCSEVTM